MSISYKDFLIYCTSLFYLLRTNQTSPVRKYPMPRKSWTPDLQTYIEVARKKLLENTKIINFTTSGERIASLPRCPFSYGTVWSEIHILFFNYSKTIHQGTRLNERGIHLNKHLTMSFAKNISSYLLEPLTKVETKY